MINTIEVVHLADIKFSNFDQSKKQIDKHLVWRIGRESPKKYFHGTFLKIVLVVTLVCQLKKKLPNYQVEITAKCTTYLYEIL